MCVWDLLQFIPMLHSLLVQSKLCKVFKENVLFLCRETLKTFKVFILKMAKGCKGPEKIWNETQLFCSPPGVNLGACRSRALVCHHGGTS